MINILEKLGIHTQYLRAMQNMLNFLFVLALIQFMVWLLPVGPTVKDFPNYIIWHDLLEAISIVISLMVFGVGWISRDKKLSGNVILLASVFFFVGVIDFCHTMSYVGMPDFFSHNDSEKHLYYWLTARLLAALVLLGVVTREWKPLVNRRSPYIVFIVLAMITLSLNWLVICHQKWLPDTFIPDIGLTQFKKNFEYVIIAINLFTIASLVNKTRKPQPYKIVMLFGAVSTMTMSELYFTSYTTMLGSDNLLGHIYKVIGYLFIYRAIVVDVIEEPFRLLKVTNEALSSAKKQLTEAQSLAKIGSWHVIFGAQPSEDKWTVSEELRKIWGHSNDASITTASGFGLIPIEDRENTQRSWDLAKCGKGPDHWEHRIIVGDSVRWIQVIAKFVVDETGKAIEASGTNQDITGNKKREWQLALLNLALNRVGEAAYLMNREGDFQYVNDAACQILGYTREELVAGMGVPDIEPGMTKAKMLDHWNELKKNHTLTLEAIHQAKNGRWFPVEINANYFEFDGESYNMALVRDISERKQLEDSTNKTLNLINKISNRVPGVVYQFLMRPDGTSCFPYSSKAIQDIFRVDPDEVRDDASKVFAVIHPGDLNEVVASIEKSARDLTPWTAEFRVHFSDGKVNWVFGNAMPERQNDGSVLWYGFCTNIDQRKQDEENLRIAATAFEAQEGISITDADQVILRVNRAFSDITGYTPEEAIGKDHRILKSGRHGADFYASMWSKINREGKWEGEIWNRRKNGEVYPEKLVISVVKNAAGVITNYISMISDITRAKAAEDEIKLLAFYDPLTRLPNRRLLLDRLNQAMAFASRIRRSCALLFIDLDNFKTLNDTLGHNFGDLLLQQVAKRLESCIRETDTVARFGGDEFVVMLEDLSSKAIEAAEQTKNIANKIIASLNQNYQLGTHTYRNTPSIGVTLFNDNSQSIEELLKQADIAMYQSKKAGRNTLHFFDPRMQETVNVRATLEMELRAAVELEQFKLFYQVQVVDTRNDGTASPVGAEALIRWLHPERGVITPAAFISLAEDTELILPIGRWVLDTACGQLKLWQQNLITKNLVLSVNVSAKQFRQSGFVEQVSCIVRSHEIDPRLLKLELTESLLLNNVNDTIEKMYALKKLGVQFSLDDFGTGYSSLQYLKQLPFEQLKIDQSFVRDLATDNNDKAIVATIIAMAKSLNINVIAEGVENDYQLQILRQEGCLQYQGYLFGKPMPIDRFEQQFG